MAIFNTNIKNTESHSIRDSKQAISLKQINSPNYRYIVNRLVPGDMDQYTDMEYDLSEHGRIIDTESLVATAFRKKRQLILKSGYNIISPDEENLQYIKKRLGEMEYVSSQSFKDCISEVAESMVNFNNCFMMKFRKEESSSGQIRLKPNGQEIKPIAGIYILSAPTIDTANNKMGNIVRYRHRITQDFVREFKPQDILHMYANKRTGITIGTPPLEAVKDDIIALRSIEQSTENMIYRNASPFMQVQVGNKDQPARILSDGTSEIDLYGNIIEKMNESGGVCTPERVKINMIGAESQALRLESYLQWFRDRVLAGLSVSLVDMGIGNSTTGGAAASISESLQDDVKAYQDNISNFISNYLFNELLLESPRYRNKFVIPEEERVILDFKIPSQDDQIKLESHYMGMVNSQVISKKAALKAMGRHETEGHIDPNDLPTENPAMTVLQAKLAPKPTGTSSSGKAKAKLKGSINTARSIVKPSNQHNKKTTKIKDSAELVAYIKNYVYNNAHNYVITDDDPRITNVYNTYLDLLEEYGRDSADAYLEDTLINICYDLAMEADE